MKDKITQLMKSERLTTSRLAELLEIQPSAVSHLVSGRNNPRYDLIIRILRRFPQINPDWLLLDSDVMYRDSEPFTAAPTADEGAEMALFDDDELLIANNAATEGSAQPSNPTKPKSPQSAHMPRIPSQASSQTTATPIRVMVLYDDGSFESFALR